MKRAILAVILIIAFFGLVQAEGLKPNFYAGAGIGLPKKPDNIVPGIDIGISDMYKSAVNFSAGVGIPLCPQFELVGRFRYSAFGFDDEGFAEKLNSEFSYLNDPLRMGSMDIEVTGADTKVMEFLADVKFKIPMGGAESAFHPYVLGGLGMANATLGEWDMSVHVDVPFFIDTTITAAAGELSETKLVYNFGAGFDWMAVRRSAFISTPVMRKLP